MDGPWVVYFQNCVRWPRPPSKMAAMSSNRFNIEPYGIWMVKLRCIRHADILKRAYLCQVSDTGSPEALVFLIQTMIFLVPTMTVKYKFDCIWKIHVPTFVIWSKSGEWIVINPTTIRSQPRWPLYILYSIVQLNLFVFSPNIRYT